MAATVASTHFHWFVLGDAGGGTGRDLGGVGGAGGVGFWLHSVTSSFMVVAPFFFSPVMRLPVSVWPQPCLLSI